MTLKLLIADDEDVIRQGVAKYIRLHTDRFEKVYEAENGQEAINMMLKYHPDVILLDIQMPQKSGIDVMKEAQRLGLNPIIIILSGYDDFKYAQQAIHLGAREYLLKPLRAADILSCINDLADERFGSQEKEEEDQLPANQFLKRAQDYITEHYMENISLDDVATELGISKGYVSTLFSQNLQCGFVDYLNKIRIERACVYLEQNYFKVYEIAYKVGFRDEKYFSKVFRKLVGMSPKEFQRVKR